MGTIRPLITLLLAMLLTATAAPALAQARDGARCASTLDCTASELESLPLRERLVFIRALQDRVAAEHVPGFRHWRNIEGLLTFFSEKGMGARGSWVSHVDSGDLEGIERGTAIALGVSDDDFGNPGAPLWADYLNRMRRGELTDRSVHDQAWSQAEQVSTDHGRRLAERAGVSPARMEWNLFQFAQLYRWMMRNPQTALILLDEHIAGPLGIPFVPADFLRWLTDVTTPVPVYRGAHAAYDISLPNPVGAPVSMLELLLAYAPELVRVYREETGAV
ncbi:hypothetical protein A8924_6014 [Saccharopolyspora erythraea NRRL 2338]|uniref:Secreted protein n=1 Tax=Saccharopolyspora erythraea TaxID=1836 RepID=A0ABN1DNK4_SACER|nr:hypothetical protein [Saccharopolyspora erythraea]EQD83806.1 hypothetical protein N599_23435 [Saccharopolyspora erythraea D]PFG98498.1 hypothetical protein A8924_6014 [Saccharopolyspora erythraea NRRL 2338]QRK88551.1 hypothetical protein JQX30_28435 [Saccharopolyspora erythraea]